MQVCSNIFLRNMLTSDTLYGNNSNMPRDLIFPSSQVLHSITAGLRSTFTGTL